MKRKQLLTMSVQQLVTLTNNIDLLINKSSKPFYTKFASNANFIEDYIKHIIITVVIDNLAKLNYLRSDDILHVATPEDMIFLQELVSHDTSYHDLKIDVLFIQSHEYTQALHFSTYLPKLIHFLLMHTDSFSLLEKSMYPAKTFIKGARKSIVKSMLDMRNFDKKYKTIWCPYCKKEYNINLNNLTRNVNFQYDKQSKNIVMKCFHKDKARHPYGNFYIPTKKYQDQIPLNSSVTQKIEWAVDNFERLVDENTQKESKL